MLLALSFLPLTAVLIQDVRAESTASSVTIDVATSEPVARADVRGVVSGAHRIWVYVQGTTAARRTFGSTEQPIVVYPRARYTKLEISTPARCSEPVMVEPTPSGVRVRATCGDDAEAVGSVAAPVRGHDGENAGKPSPEAPLAAKTRSHADAESLRAALALPSASVRAENEALSDEDASNRPSRAKPEAREAKEAREPREPKNDAKAEKATGEGPEAAAKPTVAAAAAPNTPAPAKTSEPDAPVAAPAVGDSASSSGPGRGFESKSSTGALSTAMVVVLLAGLAIAAVVFARRRTARPRLIKIVETASIGPRRSLVIANVGGRTMVLGVSEAGVALLDAQAPVLAPGAGNAQPALLGDEPAAVSEQLVAGLRALAQERSQGEAPAPETKSESSLLSRLFHQREPLAPSHAFEDLLSESLEDQDLRRKLSLGESGRVA
jgi:flagellar biogenesis protein FliO